LLLTADPLADVLLSLDCCCLVPFLGAGPSVVFLSSFLLLAVALAFDLGSGLEGFSAAAEVASSLLADEVVAAFFVGGGSTPSDLSDLVDDPVSLRFRLLTFNGVAVLLLLLLSVTEAEAVAAAVACEDSSFCSKGLSNDPPLWSPPLTCC